LWTQPFTARRFSEDGMRGELALASLVFDEWLTEDHTWFAAARDHER
jgi:hypothetical protein